MSEFDPEKHEILSSEKIFDGKVIGVYIDRVILPDGRIAKWERVNHPGAVGIVPFIDDENILMVRQYRHPAQKVMLEIPAGKLDISHESPVECAKRELVEEISYSAGEITKIAEFYNSPGYSNEYFHLYLARNLSHKEGKGDTDEFLSVEKVEINRALLLIKEGMIEDAKSIIGIALSVLLMDKRL
ncbi:MAG: NUDIX hydrolase [Actinomycetota bacterium]|nr:NUDIX hydrolase [Actinomycetota bacterium]